MLLPTGDRVLVRRQAPETVSKPGDIIDGAEHLLIRESEILAVVAG